MNDGQRVYPVDIFVLHHSTGPDFVDTDDLTIQDWYSNTGKGRAYNNGAINPMHEHPGRPGQLTYSQAQFSGSADSSNKYNYKLTDLIVNPWGQVAWHAGNWEVNQQSCGLENCGNYSDKLLEPRQLMCIADFLRIIDQELISGGYPSGIQVMLHQEIYATACPGRIKEQRDTLVDMINNPDKWNAIVFPPPVVVPPVVIPPVVVPPVVVPPVTPPVIEPEPPVEPEPVTEPETPIEPTYPEVKNPTWGEIWTLIIEFFRNLFRRK